MHNLCTRIVSSMGIHFNVLNNATELSDGFASRIRRAQRFCNPKSLDNCSFEQLPQTVQQYSSVDLINALYNNFLPETDR